MLIDQGPWAGGAEGSSDRGQSCPSLGMSAVWVCLAGRKLGRAQAAGFGLQRGTQRAAAGRSAPGP